MSDKKKHEIEAMIEQLRQMILSLQMLLDGNRVEIKRSKRPRGRNSAGFLARHILLRHEGPMHGKEILQEILKEGGQIDSRNLQSSLNREPNIQNLGNNTWVFVGPNPNDF